MKRKILALLFLFTFVTSNVNASKFKFILQDFLTKPAFKETEQKEQIYIDTKTHWCNYAAERLYNEGIFKGIKIGETNFFMPDEPITRGEFLLYLNTILNKSTSKTINLPFADAASIPSWQIPTVCAMFEAGIINGNIEKDKLYFNHSEKISRLECAIILNNMLGLENSYSSTDYYDGYLIPSYAVTAVKNVSDYGLMKGYGDGSFRPYIKITRAMLADILCSTKDYYEGKNK